MKTLDHWLTIGVLGFGIICGGFIIASKPGGSGGEEGHGDEHSPEGEGKHGEGEHEEGGHVELDDGQVATAGIKLEKAGRGSVQGVLRLRGQISANRDRQVEVAPRLAGTVQRVMKGLGESVRRGESIATIESNQTRAIMDVRSGIDGVVTELKVGRGGFASSKEGILVVADLTKVWAEFLVPDRDAIGVKLGQKMRVKDAMGPHTAEGPVAFVSPIVDLDTQAVVVRVDLDNSAGQWRPGSFVEGELALSSKDVGVAVRREAIHQLETDAVVFVREKEAFEVRRVTLGAIGTELAEIKDGIKDGESYATANSFLVKAELLKSTAEHED